MNPSRLIGALALAALISAPSLAVAQPYGNYGNNGNGSGNSRSGQVTGIIQSVQGSSFTLDNGRTVFLTQGTVLSPTGLRLQSGMQVTVTGVWAGNGAINASEVANYGNNGNYNYGNNGNGNGYRFNGQVSGIIQSVQGSSFTLDSGRTVFLKRGTIISPQGRRLRSGMQVNVTGVRAGNGSINATEVDIVRRNRQ